MVFTHIEEIEVATLINSLNNSSPGYDGIPSTLVKRTMHLYLKTLTLIINQAFYDGVFPRELKIAKVIPIYKSGSTMELNNYRPISVLNIFSKVFERLMYDRLTQFLDKYNILYHNQYGFRQYHSTHHALITLVDKITKSLDSGDIVIGVFLDLKKAFDTVDHTILLKKLHQYGIRGNLNKWFENYLANRSQYVSCNGKTSDIQNVSCGVPQGSILGPLLFILYINDFSNVSDILYYVLFADDTNVFLNGRDIHKLTNTMQQELLKLHTWLLCNKLTLNISKTHYIKNSKIAKGVGIICRAKKYFSITALIQLYNAFIYPYLIYCVEVWGNALSIHLTPLLKIQNKILRIITYTHHHVNNDQLYYNTGILPFKILVKQRIGLLMHKMANGNVTKPLQNLYQCNKNVHHHFTRQTNHLHSMRGNNEFIYRTFVFQSVFIWNTVIQNININVSYERFKHLLKDFLLSNDISFRYDK